MHYPWQVRADTVILYGWYNFIHAVNSTYVHNLCICLQINCSEIDFCEWYKTAVDLEDDENRDMYPPHFINQFNCHKPSTLDVEYKLQVVKKKRLVCEYQLNIYVNFLDVNLGECNCYLYPTIHWNIYCMAYPFLHWMRLNSYIDLIWSYFSFVHIVVISQSCMSCMYVYEMLVSIILLTAPPSLSLVQSPTSMVSTTAQVAPCDLMMQSTLLICCCVYWTTFMIKFI